MGTRRKYEIYIECGHELIAMVAAPTKIIPTLLPTAQRPLV